MDSFSDQVAFRFAIDTTRHVDRRLVRSRDYKVLADIEGHLTIFVEGKGVFNEPGVLLLELAVDLLQWVRDLQAGNRHNFTYVSMDHDEGPLLEFVQVEDKQFSLKSPWMADFSVVGPVSMEVLLKSVEAFLGDLNAKLVTCFGIRIADYLGPR